MQIVQQKRGNRNGSSMRAGSHRLPQGCSQEIIVATSRMHFRDGSVIQLEELQSTAEVGTGSEQQQLRNGHYWTILFVNWGAANPEEKLKYDTHTADVCAKACPPNYMTFEHIPAQGQSSW
ncbi:TPA: hypothetical protein ACH3X1_010590 [Trebouxia sp. C0004]